MKERLAKLIESENTSPARLAELIGVQPSAISHILSGRNKPGFDFISNLIRRFPTIDPKWLLLGEGNMYLSGADGEQSLHNTHYNTVLNQEYPSKTNQSTIAPVTNVIKEMDETHNTSVNMSKEGDFTASSAHLTDKSGAVDSVSVSTGGDTERVIILFSDGSFREYKND